MAMDTLDVVNYLGWTDKRQLHVIGVSMGGMIAQELALLVPGRIGSLSLISTAARLVNTVGFVENLRSRINMFLPRSIDVQLAGIKTHLFSEPWLEQPDADGGFPTNGDRFAAQELKKRQDADGFTRTGFVCQAIAAGWHHKSAEQLKALGDAVGRDRIQVMHGTIDNMITVPHAEVLAHDLGGEEEGVTKTIFDGIGHVIFWEQRETFNKLVTSLVEKAEAM